MLDLTEPNGATADGAIHLLAMVVVPIVFAVLVFIVWRRKLNQIRQKQIVGFIVTSDEEERHAWQETKTIIRPASSAMKLMLHVFEMAALCLGCTCISLLFGFELVEGFVTSDTPFTTDQWLWFSGLFLFFSFMTWYLGKAALSSLRQLRILHENEKRQSEIG
jgi:hypothetical protein